MPLWDDFLSTIKGAAKDVVGFAEGMVKPLQGVVTSAGSNIAAQQIAGVAAPATAAGLQEATQQAIKKVGLSAPQQAGTDLVLKASQPVGKVVSYAVNRPISTLSLLADPNSPLYQGGKNAVGEPGFQVSDVVKAWNRSEKVSLNQAFVKTPLFQDTPIGLLSTQLLKNGNVNLDKVNLWNDKDIVKNFVDNPVGRYFTGIGDFILGNVALGGVTGLAKSAGTAALKFTNFTSSIRSAEDLAKLDELGTQHFAGVPSAFGADIEQLAASKDATLVTDIVRNYSNNEILPKLILKAENPMTVKDFILADNGYLPAIERLAQTHGPDLWEMSDMNNYIKGNVVASGKLPKFEGAELERIKAVFDQSVAEVPAHAAIRDAFFDPEGNLLIKGTGYKPIDPPLIGGMIGKVRTRTAELNAASTTRDFSNVGGIAETVLGGGLNKPTTVLLHFFGTKLPRGYISFSGLRPYDHIDEVNAVFDDIPLFKNGQNDITVGFKIVDGERVPTIIKASEYRAKVIQELMNAPLPSDKAKIIDTLDNRLGLDIANSRGINNPEDVNKFVSDARATLNGTHNDLIRQGFSFDAQGNRLEINNRTQSQIADTIPMLPWGKIDRELQRLIRNQKIPSSGNLTVGAHEAVHSAFDTLNKVFSLSVLGRPAYIPKNSVIEPLTSSMLAMGHHYLQDSIGTAISNSIKNNQNRIMSAITKVKSALPESELKNVNKRVNDNFNKLNQSYQIRDEAYAEWENAFNTDSLSPAAKAEHMATIKSNLREAEKLAQKVEAELSIAVKPYGKLENIPSVYGLRRRVEFLKAQPKGAERFGSEIRSAEIAIQNAVGNINTLAPNILEQNKNLEDAWKLLDKTVENSKLSLKEQAEIMLKREQYKKRYYGSTDPVVHKIGVNQIEDSSLYDPKKFGDAIRSEFSNSDTQELNYFNELRTGSKVGILARKTPTGIVDVNSPYYFEELSYVINRQFRGDELVKQVLANSEPADIMQWAYSPSGLAYFKQFGEQVGVVSKADIPDYVMNQINTVRRYLPDQAARDYALKESTTSAGLQNLLANKRDILSPIHPTDIDYGAAASLNKIQLAGQSSMALANAAWKKMAGAENPFRWLYGDKRFQQIQQAKLQRLADQGVEITDAQVNATRQASAREALADAEKTFYTIRRNNRAIYASRTVASFPAASVNALYRFGRLAIKNPGRTVTALKNYYSMYDSFGLDKDGNPVENPMDAAYILVPGTKEMGMFSDKGVRLSTRAVGFLANTPGPSWLATYGVGKILDGKPDNKIVLKKIIDDTFGHITGLNYDTLFPQGANTDLSKSFVPGWLQDFNRFLTSPESDTEFMHTFKMTHAYNMAMYEMGLGPKPTLAQSKKQTAQWYLQRAEWKFGSIFGMTPQMDRPGQMMQDFSTALMKKNNGDTQATHDEMLQLLGPAYKNFPVDRYLYKGQSRNAYIAPTIDGYKRVWKDNAGLAEKLANIDPVLVGLMTSDIAGDPDTQVQKFLSNPTVRLPGGKPLNAEPMTPKDVEAKIQTNRTWDMYRTAKQDLMVKLTKAGYTRIADNPDVKAQWDKYITDLSKYDKNWGIEYNQNSRSDVAYKYAQAMKEIVLDKNFTTKNNSDFFQQMKTFVSYRDKLVKTLQEAPKGSKTAVQDAWNTYLQQTSSGAWNPQLQQIIDRYFLNDQLTGTL